MPSIVIGIFAYTLIVLPQKHFSTLAGGLALGVMMIPIAVRSSEEFLRAVPSLREGAMALGASKAKVDSHRVIPAAKNGIITGIMLNLARVAGETAPLLFTSFGNRSGVPDGNSPQRRLPVMILYLCHCALRRLAPAGLGGRFRAADAGLDVNIVAR